MSSTNPSNSKAPLHIAFRCDASLEIGSGHVMRCLTLAEALRDRGVNCTFITRELRGNINPHIKRSGFPICVLQPESLVETGSDQASNRYTRWLGVSLPQEIQQSREAVDQIGPDIVGVDHYALDHIWHQEVCARRAVLAIDDLADRKHDCDILLDQNFGKHADDYNELVPPRTKKLIGAKYALLRSEFRENRDASLARRKNMSKPLQLLVSMGGADLHNSTRQILDTLAQSEQFAHITLTVVMGGASPHLESVRNQAKQMPFATKVVSDITDMAAMLIDVDIAIGAAGGSVWERCCLGVPSLLLNIAANQEPASRALGEVGVAVSLGDFGNFEWKNKLIESLERVSSPVELQRFSAAAANLVDGLGASRVADQIATFANQMETNDA